MNVREQCSVARVVPPVKSRKLAKVPFIELADGQLQGVVSSGSDIERVYVSSFTARTHTYSCSTNNNRPCGGLYGSPCKHLTALMKEAVVQYGAERVARYLHADLTEDGDLTNYSDGGVERTESAMVFSGFLRHLAYLELPDRTAPIPELHWFPSSGAVR